MHRKKKKNEREREKQTEREREKEKKLDRCRRPFTGTTRYPYLTMC